MAEHSMRGGHETPSKQASLECRARLAPVSPSGSAVRSGRDLAEALTKLFKSKPYGAAPSQTTADESTRLLLERSRSARPDDGLDTLFISYGSHMTPLVDVEAKHFWTRWRKFMPCRPKAILVVSAHWCTRYPSVNSVVKNHTIHDNCSSPLFQVEHNAPGAPDVAARTTELLKGAGFSSVRVNSRRGLDHGACVPLYIMFPNADIPVFQLSVQLEEDGHHHYRMGQALAPLTREGVLIIGSGSVTHNLRNGISRHSDNVPPDWDLDFDNWLNDSLTNGRFEDVIEFEEKSRHATTPLTAHPTPGHFLPLLVAVGAAGEGAKAQRIHTSWMKSSLSMACFAFRSTHPI